MNILSVISYPSRRVAFRVGLVRLALGFARHWLFFINLLLAIWVGLPWFAPVFMHWGWTQAAHAIYFLYSLQCHQLPERSFFLFGKQTMYSLNQIQTAGVNITNPFLLRQFIGNAEMGWKVAWSDRMVPMYTSTFLFSVLYGLVRKRLKPLRLWGFAFLLMPMVIDGGAHAISDLAGIGHGFRDTNVWLATLTGNVFPSTFYAGDALGSFNSWARLITGSLLGLGVVWLAYPYLQGSFVDYAHDLEMKLEKGGYLNRRITSASQEQIETTKNRRPRWLIPAGTALALSAGLWLMFSNRKFDNPQAQPISRLSAGDFPSLAFSPTEADSVYFGNRHGLLVSHDGGKDWQATALQNAGATTLATSSSDSETMYVMGRGVLYKSIDGGNTWQSVATNLPEADIDALAVDPKNANQVYAILADFGVFGSQDGGRNWTQLAPPLALPPTVHGMTAGETAQTLYVAGAEQGIWRSLNGGRSWSGMKDSPDRGALTITYVPANRLLFVSTMGNQAGLYVSADGGKTWTSTGLKGTIVAFAVSPLDAHRLIAVNSQGQVYQSPDGGLTWPGE